MAASVKCPHCQAVVTPTWGDLLPSGAWFITCRACGRECWVSRETKLRTMFVGLVCLVTSALVLTLRFRLSKNVTVLLGVTASYIPMMFVARRILRLQKTRTG